MHWLLIIFLMPDHDDANAMIQTVQFETRQLCEQAKTQLTSIQIMPDGYRKNWYFMRSECVLQQGK